MIYAALGDSISIDDYTGVDGGGAASQLARRLGVDTFVNLTSDGNTTSGVLNDLVRLTDRPDVVTLTAGGNDFLRAAFMGAMPGTPEGQAALIDEPLAALGRIAFRLRGFGAVTILNTIYDPTDGRDDLGEQLGLPPAYRTPFEALNDGIRDIAREEGFLLADLRQLFQGHGLGAPETWIVRNIEPNLAGATAIAEKWHHIIRDSMRLMSH